MSVPAAPPKTTGIERKIFSLVDVKARAADPGGIEGYGAIFNNIDSYGDMIVKGAFLETIPQFMTNGFASVGHAWSDLPVATFSDAHEDDKGLYIVAEYHTDDYSQRTRGIVKERIDRQKSVGLSIGFMVKDGGAVIGRDDNGFPVGVRILTNLELFEVSIVNVPANPAALATAAKNAQYLCSEPTCGCRLGMTHHKGLKFAEHGDTLLAEVRGYLERVKSHADMRAKQQRTPDDAQTERLSAILVELRSCSDSIEGLIPTIDPAEAKDDAQVRAELARFEILRAQSMGVGALA